MQEPEENGENQSEPLWIGGGPPAERLPTEEAVYYAHLCQAADESARLYSTMLSLGIRATNKELLGALLSSVNAAAGNISPLELRLATFTQPLGIKLAKSLGNLNFRATKMPPPNPPPLPPPL